MVCAFVEIMIIEKKEKNNNNNNNKLINSKFITNYNNTLIISIVRGKG